MRSGTVAAAVVNVWKKKGERPASPADFCPDFERKEEAQPQSTEDMAHAMKCWTRLLGGEVIDNGERGQPGSDRIP